MEYYGCPVSDKGKNNSNFFFKNSFVLKLVSNIFLQSAITDRVSFCRIPENVALDFDSKLPLKHPGLETNQIC